MSAKEAGNARFWITFEVGPARLTDGSDVGEREELRMFPRIEFQRLKTSPL